MNFYYEGVWRLDWGFGNPNRTAALIVALLLASWAFAYAHRRGFWFSLAISLGLGVCLIQTFSRGGLVAAAVGAVALLWWAPRPWPKSRIIAVGFALITLSVYAEFLSASGRYASSWQGDPSVLNRLTLWQSVPRMMVDAPWGWGQGHSQEAYMLWYQPPDHHERFLNLVSLHFTLLAEWSWPLRLLYLFGWLAAFVLAFPNRNLPALSVPFSVLLALFVAGIFSHFGNAWILYLLPFLAVLATVAMRGWRRSFPQLPMFAGAGLAALLLAAAFYLVGKSEGYMPVHGGVAEVVVGRGSPAAWVMVDPAVLGLEYGKALRRYRQDHPECPTLAFVKPGMPIPPANRVLLSVSLTPAVTEVLKKANPREVILLNPACFPLELKNLLPAASVKAFFGEFSHSPSQSVWRDMAMATTVEGAGDFLPQWPSLLIPSLAHE